MDRNCQNFLATIKQQQQAIIVGPLVEFSRFSWPIATPYLWVDGAANFRHLCPNGLHLVVGDGDSTQIPMDMAFSPDKDFSDLAGALQLLQQQTCQLELRGFLGGRADHQLAVYGEIFHFLRCDEHCQVIIFESHHLFLNPGQYRLKIQGNFSILSGEQQLIQVTGEVKYPLLQPRQLDAFSSFGISNQAFAGGLVEINCQRPILVMSFNPEKLPLLLHQH